MYFAAKRSRFFLVIAVCTAIFSFSSCFPVGLRLKMQSGGGGCQSIESPCSEIEVEIDRFGPTGGSVSTCPSELCSSSGNPFYQWYYKVRLHYTGNEANTFILPYSELEVDVQLSITGPQTGVKYSRIDAVSTAECFSDYLTSNSWDATVILIPNEADNMVSFTIENPDGEQNPCGDNMISFVDGYSDLFTVTVNVYPDETVQMTGINAKYTSLDNGICSLDSNPSNEEEVPLPVSPVNTNNENLLVYPSAAVSESGGCYFPIYLRNLGNSNVTVDYAEFLVKVALSNATLGEINEKHQSTDVWDPIVFGNYTYIHVKAKGIGSLNASTGVLLGKIHFDRPTNDKLTWTVSVQCQETGKTRVQTSSGCTGLPFNGTAQEYDAELFSYCDDPVFTFTISCPENMNDECDNNVVRLSLSASPAGTYYLKEFLFSVALDLSGGIEIEGIDYGTLFPSGCVEDDPGQPNTGYSVFAPDCYNIDGNVLSFQTFYYDDLPINLSSGAKYIDILLSNDGGGCIYGASLTSILIKLDGEDYCVPNTATVNADFPRCPFRGFCQTENDNGVSEVGITLEPDDGCAYPATDQFDYTTDNGGYVFCVFPDCDVYTITPLKDDNSLNGVTTYDLVLISKHILGLELFDSPYKYIAADANKSNSVTTFDIVEIRKLILGIYNDPGGLPANTSWRFVQKNYDFPDPDDPWYESFPEIKTIDIGNQLDPGATDFVAIKIGDINNSALGSKPAEMPELAISWSSPGEFQKGEVITIPVSYSGNQSIEALQIGLRFDPSQLELITPSMGDVSGVTPQSFGLTKAAAGEIRFCWLQDFIDPFSAPLTEGATLFYLSFKLLQPISSEGLSLETDDNILTCSAWNADGSEYSIRFGRPSFNRTNAVSNTLNVMVQPNPTDGVIQFKVETSTPGKVRLALFDPFGRLQLMQDAELGTGSHNLSLPASSQLPAGVYWWKVSRQSDKVQGIWIKQ